MSIIQNINDFEYNNILNKFGNFYPDIDPWSIDPELLQNMLDNIALQNNTNRNVNPNVNPNIDPNVNPNIDQNIDPNIDPNINPNINTDDLNEINNFNKNIIENNMKMADETIPEMIIQSELIYLKGRLNNTPVNVMIDTGATGCFTYKSIMTKCGVDHLIDGRAKKIIRGVNGSKTSAGTIWFLEIDLDISNGQEQWVSIPVSIDVNDDTDVINQNNLINSKLENKISIMKEKINTYENSNDKKYLLEEIELFENEIEIQKKHMKNTNLEIILGINFLKSYRANIDFSTRILTLNDSIKIKFK